MMATLKELADQHIDVSASAVTFRASGIGLRTFQVDVYQDASDFCAKQGRVVETVKLVADDGYIGHLGSVNLQFRCVMKSN
jgi:hypothetical protein